MLVVFLIYMYLVHSAFGVFGALARTALAGALALRYRSLAILILGTLVFHHIANAWKIISHDLV